MCKVINMIAKMEDDDDAIEQLIQAELDALDVNDLDIDDDFNEDEIAEEEENDNQFDSAIEDYLSTIKSYNEKAEKRMDEADKLLNEFEKVNFNTDDLLKEKLCEVLDDPNQATVLDISNEVLLQLESLNEKEEPDKEENFVENNEESNESIAVFEEIKVIEDKAHIELQQLCQQHRLVEENLRLFEERKKEEDQKFDELMRERREAKIKELENLQLSFKKNNEELTNTLQDTLNLEVTHMKKFEDDMKEKLDVIDKDYIVEKERLMSFQDEMTKLTDEKLNNSAITIQKHFKRHRVQQKYASEITFIKEKTFQLHEAKINEKVKEKERVKAEIDRKHREKLLKEENERKERERLEKEKEERRRIYEEQKSLIAKQRAEMKSQETVRSSSPQKVQPDTESGKINVQNTKSGVVQSVLADTENSGDSCGQKDNEIMVVESNEKVEQSQHEISSDEITTKTIVNGSTSTEEGVRSENQKNDFESSISKDVDTIKVDKKEELSTGLKKDVKSEILDLCEQLDDTSLNSSSMNIDGHIAVRSENKGTLNDIEPNTNDKEIESGPEITRLSLIQEEPYPNKVTLSTNVGLNISNTSNDDEMTNKGFILRQVTSENGSLKEENKVPVISEDEGYIENIEHIENVLIQENGDRTNVTIGKSEHSIKSHDLVHTDSGFSNSGNQELDSELHQSGEQFSIKNIDASSNSKIPESNKRYDEHEEFQENKEKRKVKEVDVEVQPSCSCFQLNQTDVEIQPLSQLYKDWLTQHKMESSRERKPVKVKPVRKRRFFSKSNSTPLTEDQIRDGCYETKNIAKVQVVSLEKIADPFSCQPLSQCSYLECLNISECSLETFEGVEECKDMKSLSITHCNLSNLDVKFDHLSFLNLSHNDLSGIHGLEMLPSLIYLDLSHNNILRISGFEQCRSLLYLNLDDNQVISTRGMEHLSKLMYFSSANNNVSFFEEVKKLPLLQVLNLSGNTLTKIPPLSDNVLLKELYLDNNNVTKMDNLKDYWLPQLNTLSIIGNCLQELPDIGNLLSLQHFIVENNLLSNVEIFSVLRSCHNLKNLKVFGNAVATAEEYRTQLKKVLPQLEEIDGEAIEASKGVCTCLEGVCESQNSKYIQLKEQIDTNWRFQSGESVESLLERQNLQRIYWEQLYEESTKQISEHKNIIKEETPNIDLETKDTFLEPESNAENLSQSIPEQSPNETTAFTDSPEHKELCATKIQAVYRGYHGRKLFEALRHASTVVAPAKPAERPPPVAVAYDEDSDFEYDEVDLDQFNMADEDMEWEVPETPQLPTRGPPLPNISPSIENKTKEKDAWRSPTTTTPSPPTQSTPGRSTSLTHERNPSSLATSRCGSKGLSKKAEVLSDEWGFQSEVTAELMLKRAKRLGKAKKKKTNSADRYQLFKKSEEASQLSAVSPGKKKAPERISYFKETSPVPVDQNQQTNSKEMTYRWVCNQPVFHADRALEVMSRNADYYTEVEKRAPTTDRKTRNGSAPLTLPQMDPSVIAGRPPSLVQSEIHNPKPPNMNRSTSGSGKARRRLHASQQKSHSAPNPDKRTDLCITNSELGEKWKSYAYR